VKLNGVVEVIWVYWDGKAREGGPMFIRVQHSNGEAEVGWENHSLKLQETRKQKDAIIRIYD
jgi:hypothetical protein